MQKEFKDESAKFHINKLQFQTNIVRVTFLYENVLFFKSLIKKILSFNQAEESNLQWTAKAFKPIELIHIYSSYNHKLNVIIWILCDRPILSSAKVL